MTSNIKKNFFSKKNKLISNKKEKSFSSNTPIKINPKKNFITDSSIINNNNINNNNNDNDNLEEEQHELIVPNPYPKTDFMIPKCLTSNSTYQNKLNKRYPARLYLKQNQNLSNKLNKDHNKGIDFHFMNPKINFNDFNMKSVTFNNKEIDSENVTSILEAKKIIEKLKTKLIEYEMANNSNIENAQIIISELGEKNELLQKKLKELYTNIDTIENLYDIDVEYPNLDDPMNSSAKSFREKHLKSKIFYLFKKRIERQLKIKDKYYNEILPKRRKIMIKKAFIGFEKLQNFYLFKKILNYKRNKMLIKDSFEALQKNASFKYLVQKFYDVQINLFRLLYIKELKLRTYKIKAYKAGNKKSLLHYYMKSIRKVMKILKANAIHNFNKNQIINNNAINTNSNDEEPIKLINISNTNYLNTNCTNNASKLGKITNTQTSRVSNSENIAINNNSDIISNEPKRDKINFLNFTKQLAKKYKDNFTEQVKENKINLLKLMKNIFSKNDYYITTKIINNSNIYNNKILIYNKYFKLWGKEIYLEKKVSSFKSYLRNKIIKAFYDETRKIYNLKNFSLFDRVSNQINAIVFFRKIKYKTKINRSKKIFNENKPNFVRSYLLKKIYALSQNDPLIRFIRVQKKVFYANFFYKMKHIKKFRLSDSIIAEKEKEFKSLYPNIYYKQFSIKFVKKFLKYSSQKKRLNYLISSYYLRRSIRFLFIESHRIEKYNLRTYYENILANLKKVITEKAGMINQLEYDNNDLSYNYEKIQAKLMEINNENDELRESIQNLLINFENEKKNYSDIKEQNNLELKTLKNTLEHNKDLLRQAYEREESLQKKYTADIQKASEIHKNLSEIINKKNQQLMDLDNNKKKDDELFIQERRKLQEQNALLYCDLTSAIQAQESERKILEKENLRKMSESKLLLKKYENENKNMADKFKIDLNKFHKNIPNIPIITKSHSKSLINSNNTYGNNDENINTNSNNSIVQDIHCSPSNQSAHSKEIYVSQNYNF